MNGAQWEGILGQANTAPELSLRRHPRRRIAGSDQPIPLLPVWERLMVKPPSSGDELPFFDGYLAMLDSVVCHYLEMSLVCFSKVSSRLFIRCALGRYA